MCSVWNLCQWENTETLQNRIGVYHILALLTYWWSQQGGQYLLVLKNEYFKYIFFTFKFLIVNIEINYAPSFIEYTSVSNPSSLCFVKMVLFTHTNDITGDISIYKPTNNTAGVTQMAC